jgi:uncharacterized membrane protein YfcA
VGTPLGIFFVEPQVSGLWVKLIFSVLWASFGVLTIWKLKMISNPVPREHTPAEIRRLDFVWGLAIGVFGGMTVAAITGVGIDMLIYLYLILVRRSDLKVAIPTSVVLMAVTSLVGVTSLACKGHDLQPVFPHWLAASPIVILGAPLGAVVVQWVGRGITLWIVSILCVVQLIWFCWTDYSQLHLLHWVSIVCGTVLGTLFCVRILEYESGNSATSTAANS